MKYLMILLLLLITACYDEFPVSEKRHVPIDKNLLGTWKIISEFDNGEKRWNAFDEQGDMVILKWSEYEYVINFEDLYFRAYGIHLSASELVLQTELLDRKNQYITSKFSVWSYEEQDDTLIISLLNHDLLKTTFTKPDSVTSSVYVKNSREYRRHVMNYSESDSLFFNVYKCVRDGNREK